ncbi:MAG TPA: hypothetical protein VM537_20190 [Anaerolineae bacterium]|nr:hypothetical protein [Anaerolineae bacterium]
MIPELALEQPCRSLVERVAGLVVGNFAQCFEIDVFLDETLLVSVEGTLFKEMLHGLTDPIVMVGRVAQAKPEPHMPQSVE